MKLNKKNKILLTGVLIMLVISYKLAIQNTIELASTYNSNLDRKELIKDIPKQLALLSQKEQYLDSQLNSLNIDNSSLQNSLLKFLNKESEKNKVKIIEFNSPHIFRTELQSSETYIFNLEGTYTNVLKIVHALENNGSFGAISHLELEKKKDYRRKRTYLEAKIFLEQVK